MKGKDDKIVHCSLMGMGKDHICRNFSEKKCKLCQLKNMYNNKYSWIISMVDSVYTKEPNVHGVVIVLVAKKGLAVRHKEYVNDKLVELCAIRMLIGEIENEN